MKCKVVYVTKTIERYHYSWRSQLKQILGEKNVIEDAQSLKSYNQDWTYKFKGQSTIALTPRTTTQVSEVLKLLNLHKVFVVPQVEYNKLSYIISKGGNTGLVGGSVPIKEEVILSLKYMNQIEKFDPDTNILTMQSGCILQNVNEYLGQYDCEMPWDLGARGTCTVGGNASTNAGGLNVIKKGLLRSYIMGMEVVLASGQILDLTYNNSWDCKGLDLKQIFIGAEGCLGVITKMNVLTTFKTKEKKVLFIQLNKYEDVLETLKLAKRVLHDALYAFEFIEGRLVARTCEVLNLTSPFDQRAEIKNNKFMYYVLVEAQGNLRIDNIVENFAGQLFDRGLCVDCVFNKNESEYNQLWSIRDGIAEAQGKMGFVLKYDISIPPILFENFANQIYPNRMQELPFTSIFGHVGDGNLHFNIVYDTLENLEIGQRIIEPRIFSLVKKYRGSISAEHGIGQNKSKYLPEQKGEETMKLLKDLKHLLDPNNILNPGKVLVPTTQQYGI